MKVQKNKKLNKQFIIKTCVGFSICLVLLLSLFFSPFFEKILNNTWAFYDRAMVSSEIKLHFIDVGQGDCCLVQVGNTNIMIDTGNEESGNNIIRYLNNLGFYKNDKIDYLILTHTDLDHVGGAVKIINEFEFLNIYIPKIYSNFEVENGLNKFDYNVNNSSIWDKISRAIHKEVSLENLFYNFKDEEILNNNFSMHFYTPLEDKLDESNAYSPIIMLHCPNFKAIFTGDAGYLEEYSFLNYYKNLTEEDFFDCDVLKIGHHGSKYSTTEAFLSVVKPEISVISVGKDNSYGHPTEEVLKKLDNINSKVLRTDLTGSIVVYKNDETIKYKTNFNFIGTVYFTWWYFVVTLITLTLIITFSLKPKNH